MRTVESSLFYRSLRNALRWADAVVSSSFTGRALGRGARACGNAFGGSRIFGSSGSGRPAAADGSGPLRDAPGSLSVTVAALASATNSVQTRVAGGAVGRTLAATNRAASSSAYAGGNWLRLAGAGLLGLGCGMLPSRSLVSVVLIAVGLLLVVAGRWALMALAGSRLARWAGGGGDRRSTRGPGGAPGVAGPGGEAGAASSAMTVTTWLAAILCAVAGVLAGASPGNGTSALLALALAVVAVGLLLWRPQAILLVIAAFPWVDYAARATPSGPGPLWDDALLAVSMALLLWSVLVLGREAPRLIPIALPLLLTLAAAVGSIVVGGVPAPVGLYALRVLFGPILFYLIGFLFPKNLRWVRLTVGVFLITTTALALHGLYQYVTHAPMPAGWVDASETGIAVRAYSVVQNPNVLGALLAMGALISGSLALSQAFRSTKRWCVAIVCAVQLAGLAATFSRGAWLGLLVGLVGMIVLAYRRYLVALVAAGVVAWFAAPRVLVDRIVFTFSSTYSIKSAAGLGRLYRWDTAIDHIVAHPLLGVGLGTFGGTSAFLFGYSMLWVDNFYLQMAAEGGLLMLLFFLWMLLSAARGLVRGHRVTSDPYLKAAAAGMFGAFLAIAVADAFEADWETLAVGVEYWFLAGLITSAALGEEAG